MKKMIPSMGGTAVGAMKLRGLVQCLSSGTSIVELGTWLGALTEQVGLGIQDTGEDIDVHTYDWFEIHGNEVGKAAAWGAEVSEGEDTLMKVKESLDYINAKIYLHKCEIKNIEWSGRKISMYIDDACKYEPEFMHSIKTFSPFWIPGETIIVLMDYYFYEWRPEDPGLLFQKQFMETNKDCFEFLWDWKKYCVAIFKYKGGLKI